MKTCPRCGRIVPLIDSVTCVSDGFRLRRRYYARHFSDPVLVDVSICDLSGTLFLEVPYVETA